MIEPTPVLPFPQIVTPTKTETPTEIATSTNNLYIIVPIPTYLPPPGFLWGLIGSPYIIPSPNGKWIADRSLEMTVYHISGSIVWQFEKSYERFGGANFSAVKWSNDSRYLYFSRYPLFDGPDLNLDNGNGYWRLDILSGEITEMIPSTGDDFKLSAYALSPENSKVAVIREYEHPLKLVILDLETGVEDEIISLDSLFTQGGQMLWSPDGKQIALSASNWDGDSPNTNYSVILVDLNQRIQRVLVSFELENALHYEYSLLQWSELGMIEFKKDNCTWYFDIQSQEFIANATPTPEPYNEKTFNCSP